jgi:hypothetical protein
LTPALLATANGTGATVEAVYAAHCASCHGASRYGGYSPPLIPEALKRKSDETLAEIILRGLPNTQMLAYENVIDANMARSLVGLLRRSVGDIRWGLSDIAASRVAFEAGPRRIPANIRRGNLIGVVERGTGSVALLDGDTFRELDRFPVGRVHGGLKFDRAWRSLFASTREGTLVAYDLVHGGLRAKAKVGVNTRNLAVSPEGDFVAVANQLPAGLVVLDGTLAPLRHFPLDGQPSGVYQVPGEQRFLLGIRDRPVLFELSYPELALREIALPEPFEDFSFVAGGSQILASSRGGRRILLWDLREGREVASLETEALPHLFSACFFSRDGRRYAALNHVGVPKLSILDMESFRIEKTIPLVGSGFFVRTHPGTPYLWADTNTETVQLVDKQTLELVGAGLTPEPGKKALHVEFTAEGDRALVSVWDPVGAVVIYDAETLVEVRRLPYAMPVGKYNTSNKTRLLR